MDDRQASASRTRWRWTAIAIATLVAAFWLVTGAWAFLVPGSFDSTVATFAPANRHLTHDVGAFSIGIGATVSFGLWRRALFVTLGGASVAAAFHAISHGLDHGLGGRNTDPYTLSAFALLSLFGTFAASRAEFETRGPGAVS